MKGSNHLLLQALADFPAVASRQIDAEPGSESDWHELGRALARQSVQLPITVPGRVTLIDFGAPQMVVDGEPQHVGLAKTNELFAYLCLHRGVTIERGRLLDALFDGRSDASARSYLRQAFSRLRNLLPDGSELRADAHGVGLADDAPVSCESQRFETAVHEAFRLLSDARLAAMLEALTIYDRGPYLSGVESAWAQERRGALERIADEARLAAAEHAYAQGRLSQAGGLVDTVLGEDPYQESAWRLRMRISGALGDESGVLAAFVGCEQALADLDTGPSPTTRTLLESLRR